MKTFLVVGAAALALAGSAVHAGGPYQYGGYGGVGGYGGFDGGYSACEACGSTFGCCDHPYSKNDHLWDNYCQEKWCPKVHASRLQPYWHGAPYSSCSSCMSAPACAGPSCGAGVGSYGGNVSFTSTGSAGQVGPTPSMQPVATPNLQTAPLPAVPNSPRPAAPAPPSLSHPTPSAPMPPKDSNTLELKLLSRPRTAPQP